MSEILFEQFEIFTFCWGFPELKFGVLLFLQLGIKILFAFSEGIVVCFLFTVEFEILAA